MSYSLRYAYILCFPFSWFHLLENSQLDMMNSLFFISAFDLLFLENIQTKSYRASSHLSQAWWDLINIFWKNLIIQNITKL